MTPVERSPLISLPPGYSMRQGSTLDRAKLLKFMHLTYLELAPQGDLSHLAQTVEQYFSQDTPIWWVTWPMHQTAPVAALPSSPVALHPIACLWVGTAIDQRSGDRHAHIFLLYVAPEHRRQGIGTVLMQQAEQWALARGDRQIGLQVFQTNQPALKLYQHLGYQTESLGMVKPLSHPDRL
ncbi:MAG: GNAT family N-acetyltransferase [Leptolyngbyaceae cyanobacterium bins.349]|nr:GNAT family N-acetyltransferase [Leptolyngbyaceae cyanobacterium bins.349]